MLGKRKQKKSSISRELRDKERWRCEDPWEILTKVVRTVEIYRAGGEPYQRQRVDLSDSTPILYHIFWEAFSDSKK